MKANMKKLLLSVAAVLVVAFIGLVPAQTTYAASNNLTEKEDDPEYGRANGYIEDGFFDTSGDKDNKVYSASTGSTYTGQTYIHNSRFDGYSIINGIDVSKYQKDIDWSAVKAAGIDYAFIRVGYRGSTSGGLFTDEYYAVNLRNAAAAGIQVGVYIYSQAVTPAEAVEEANYVLNLVSGYNITMPIVIDYEYDSYHTGRLYKANLSKQAATDICNSFCAKVEAAGYNSMVYANKSMLESSMNASGIPYNIWLANYTTQTSYAGNYVCWQYTSSGKVNGISGNVDCNYWYGDLSNIYTGNYNGVDYTDVFDPDYYANYNPDIAAICGNNKQALLKHFVFYGMAEGRRANAEFCVQAYRDRYMDLAKEYGADFKEYYLHYINFGKAEGRDGSVTSAYAMTSYGGVNYSSVYDYEEYTKLYPDVASAFKGDDLAALQHFVNFGMTEARVGRESFNVKAYYAQNADLRLAFGNDLKQYYLHYINFGKAEGRKATGSTDITKGITVYNGVDYSAVYDYQYYIGQYKDIAAAFPNDDSSTLEHFVNFGMTEGRIGCENFNVKAYRAQYSDLRQVYGTDLRQYYLHYINFGKAEGRKATGSTDITNGITVYNGVDYSAIYDYQYYIQNNKDVAAAYSDDEVAVLGHFVNFGMTEGRVGCKDFNVKAYRATYSDLRRIYGTDLRQYYMHYMLFGKAEGRTGNGSTAISNGVTVYNGVDYSAVYDYQYYIKNNKDVAAAYPDDDAAVLEHFVNFGMSEGRQGNSEFNAATYKNNYTDLASVYGNELKQYYMHYILFGKAEGRVGSTVNKAL